MRRRKRMRIGLAVSGDGLTAVSLDPARGDAGRFEATVSLPDLTRATLSRAFAGLRGQLDVEAIDARVALLPPLVELKTLELPWVGREKLTAMLESRSTRHFLSASGKDVVAIAPMSSTRNSPVRVAATRVSRDLIESMLAAAEKAGWRMETVVSGYDVLARHWVETADGAAAEEFVGALLRDEVAEFVHVARGRACCVRRMCRARFDPDRPPAPMACGAEPTVALPPHDARDLVGDVAARMAEVVSPELSLPETRASRRSVGRRIGAFLLAAAAVALLVAAGVSRWGVSRELEAVRTARASIRPEVESLLAERRQLATLEEGLGLLTSLERTAPDWPLLLEDLARRVPTDAHLVWMQASADSLRIEGTARDASAVLEALRGSDAISRVRAEAPFERVETERGERERFRLAADVVGGAGSP